MMSLATPTYNHLKSEDFARIYEPAEDTFLMIDALEKDADLIKSLRADICMEIGPGSGLLITFLTQMIGQPTFSLASDVNKHACYATVKTANENRSNVDCVVDRSIRSLKHRLKFSVDILLFNPPYVVTPSNEVGSEGIEASWAGGVNGREVIDEMLPVIVEMISSEGLFYLLLLEENKPDEIFAYMRDNGFDYSVILRRRTGPERLLVVRFRRSRHMIEAT